MNSQGANTAVFNQMTQMMLSYYETLKCTIVSVKSIDTQENFNKMSYIYTKMCTASMVDGPPSEELREYGASIQTDECLDQDSCWNCHRQSQMRRQVFNQLGSLTYMPVPCTEVPSLCQSSESDQAVNTQTPRCQKGNLCRSAHNQNEIIYHPLAFRTLPCPSLSDNPDKACERRTCPNYHSEAEKRIISKFATPLRDIVKEENKQLRDKKRKEEKKSKSVCSENYQVQPRLQ